LDASDFEMIKNAAPLAARRVAEKGSDDIFRPPFFSSSIESQIISSNHEKFINEAITRAVKFFNVGDIKKGGIEPALLGLVSKDQNSFRVCAWIDPFDAVKYLTLAAAIFPKIEIEKLPLERKVVHSHRMSMNKGEIFDADFGYDSFRSRSSELSKEYLNKWKVVTDISNFFDRISHHSLKNHLTTIGCNTRVVNLINELLAYWSGDRRSFGLPVGSDASRILSEAVLLDVDKALVKKGFVFVRYVDDYRIFADTKAKAYKAVEVLTTLLAEEGLTLNSKKTEIFRILDQEELSKIAADLSKGEHEKIDLTEKVEIKRAVRVSGKSAISKFFREPGKEALKKIKDLNKDDLLREIESVSDQDFEQHLRMVVKYFIYADQDVNLLSSLLERKTTAIFYIVDALIKEAELISGDKRSQVGEVIWNSIDWKDCAYPLQIPLLRLFSHAGFENADFIRDVFEAHKISDSPLFYREILAFGGESFDRSQVRNLSNQFGSFPVFIRRILFALIAKHASMAEDEKRPILKNLKQAQDDWFIDQLGA
jgi:hypothetical protein